jgi:NAD(P)-dependent dehydrogenase (short-subunit alcohol dehydrogenase family)
MTADMTGKICIVTGANSGIGFVTAKALVQRGAEVSIVCRNAAKAKAALDAIEAATERRPRLFLADLSDLDAVRRVGRELADAHDQIDVLINNAGAYFPRRMESPKV